MHEYFGVMVSDAISKNNLRLATSAIHKALAQHWKTGLPMCVSHDAHRLIGWNLPVGIHLEPGLARLLAVSLVTENDNDTQALERAYQNRLFERVQESVGPHESELRRLIGPTLAGDEKLAYLNTAALVGPGLARRYLPDLFAQADKDGLISIQLLDPVQPGIYKFGSLVVFAHPFFRRSLSRLNNLNGELLSTLENLKGRSDTVTKIRLDEDAIGLASDCREPMQYWRGPHFDDNLASIPTGVTQHEANERQKWFSLVFRTEFWWQSRRNDTLQRKEHIFEAEELRDRYTFGGTTDLYGCRYVHSVIDEHSNRIEHLDGAIREYTDEMLLERMEMDIAAAGRHTQYTKYWRVDGIIPLSTWKTLVYHHFRDNPLAGEYLGADKEVSSPEATAPILNAIARTVPHAGAGNGVRVVLSYHHFDDEPLIDDRVLELLERVS